MLRTGQIRLSGENMPDQEKLPNLFLVPTYAETVSREMYPTQGGQYDQQDAARHMLASGMLARKYSPETAELLGRLHEYTASPLQYFKMKLGLGKMPHDYEQDLYNNALGARIGAGAASQQGMEDVINFLADQAKKNRIEGLPWIGRPTPVKKAQGGLAQYKECTCGR